MFKKFSTGVIALFISVLFIGVAFQETYGEDLLDKKINIEALRNQIGLKVTVYLTKGDKKAGKLIEITDQWLVLKIKESVFYSKEHKILFSEISEIRDAQGNPIKIEAYSEDKKKDTIEVDTTKESEKILSETAEKPTPIVSKETRIEQEPSIERLFSVIDSLKAEKEKTAVLQKQSSNVPESRLEEGGESKIPKEKKVATPQLATVVTQPPKYNYTEEPKRKEVSVPVEKPSLLTKSDVTAIAKSKTEQKVPDHLAQSNNSKIRKTKTKKAKPLTVAQTVPKIISPKITVSSQKSETPVAATHDVLETLKDSIDRFNKTSGRFTLVLVILSVSFVSLITMMILRRKSDFGVGRNEMTQLPFRVIKVREDYAIVDEGLHGGLEEGEILLVKRRGNSGLYDIGVAQAVIVLDNRSGIQLIEKLTDTAFHVGDIIYKVNRRRRRSLTKALLEKSKPRQLKSDGDLVPIVAKSPTDHSHQEGNESLTKIAVSSEETSEPDTISDFLPVPPSDVKKGVKVKAIVYTTE